MNEDISAKLERALQALEALVCPDERYGPRTWHVLMDHNEDVTNVIGDLLDGR